MVDKSVDDLVKATLSTDKIIYVFVNRVYVGRQSSKKDDKTRVLTSNDSTFGKRFRNATFDKRLIGANCACANL